LRRALFQVHLWIGLCAGLYIVLISVTGSAVVFRTEIFRAFTAGPTIVPTGAHRLTPVELKAAVEHAYPGFAITQTWPQRNPNEAVEIWLERKRDSRQRLFDPFTGRDLGNSVPLGIHAISWLVDLHDNLLAGSRGRLANGIGSLLVCTLWLTGVVIWWPGRRGWRRAVTVRRSVGWKRFTWDLHSAIGFWSGILIAIWALTGIYFAFPRPFAAVVDFFEPPDDLVLAPRHGDVALRWFINLHFGRFAGWPVKALWLVLGLAPAVLFVTGVLMWWNRVLRKWPAT
jgi:uncharacterized iron-regulated membrane protein